MLHTQDTTPFTLYTKQAVYLAIIGSSVNVASCKIDYLLVDLTSLFWFAQDNPVDEEPPFLKDSPCLAAEVPSVGKIFSI